MTNVTVVNGGAVPVASAMRGYSHDDVLDMWADSVIDLHRYGEVDRVLALYDLDVPALMPSSDELKAFGIDVVNLARALEAGLDPELFGRVIDLGLDISCFNQRLQSLAFGVSVVSYNEMMALVLDRAADSSQVTVQEDREDYLEGVLNRHEEPVRGRWLH